MRARVLRTSLSEALTYTGLLEKTALGDILISLLGINYLIWGKQLIHLLSLLNFVCMFFKDTTILYRVLKMV